MPIDIVMPQMGESIVEGTITKWLKKPGDKIRRDEPLFEISTDKVDAEIPAPASGTLQDIKVSEGATVQVNTVVGTIAADGEATTASPGKSAAQAQPEPPEKKKEAPATQETRGSVESVEKETAGDEEDGHTRSSPLVRKMAREHSIELSQVPGTGLGGRITKQDVLAFIEGHDRKAPPSDASTTRVSTNAPPAARSVASIPGDLVPLTQMRKIIAQRMIVPPHQRPCPLHVRSGYHLDRASAE